MYKRISEYCLFNYKHLHQNIYNQSFIKNKGKLSTQINLNFLNKSKNFSTYPERNEYSSNENSSSRVLSFFHHIDKGIILDMTFGDGHHTSKILEMKPNVKVIALDRDIASFRLAMKLKQEKFGNRILPLLGKIR